ncbi:hypothetical protein AOLI_G00092450 [Acnodon oligacanthus]
MGRVCDRTSCTSSGKPFSAYWEFHFNRFTQKLPATYFILSSEDCAAATVRLTYVPPAPPAPPSPPPSVHRSERRQISRYSSILPSPSLAFADRSGPPTQLQRSHSTHTI